MSINGVPIKLIAPDERGNLTQTETPVFATVRRCPALLGALKAINRASIAEAVATKRARAEAAGVDEADGFDQLDAAAAAAGEAADALADATAAVFAAIRAFVVCGFTGAGYTEEQAQRYADLVPADRLNELRQACQLGCGPLDFSKPPKGG
jgi:hypothetical protein